MAITPNHECIQSQKLRIDVQTSARIYQNPEQHQSSGSAHQARDYMRWYKGLSGNYVDGGGRKE